VKLRFTVRATENLAEIAEYLHRHNPRAAVRARAAIYEALKILLLFPRAGRQQTTDSVRKLVTPRFGYLIYYLVDDEADELVVLNVKHPARQREHDDK
jgi:plasmid stabilization system protein ParE